MSFLGWSPDQAKKPDAVVLPDGRKRLTRYFQTTTTGQIPPALDLAPGTADYWTDAPTGWTGLLLTYKKFVDDLAPKGQDTRPILSLIYEQISATAETPVGNPTVVVNQYGYLEVTYEWVQFSTNAFIPQTVGTATAASPWEVCVLRDQEAPDDGTLRHIKRTYVQGGELSDVSELRFGGKLTIRTLRYLNQVPPTPAGYTLVGPGVEYINGLPVYSYQFAQASNGSGGGTGGQVSQGFTNNQGGNTAFNPASPNSATGDVICTTSYVTNPAITTNPVTQPTGFVLFAVDVQDESGFRMWETKSGFGGGSEITVDVVGQSDGALIYSVSQNDDNGNLIPSYPGTGTAYNIKLTHTRDNGFWRNVAIWQKPPATITFKKQINFTKPGSAEFTGSPPQFVLNSPVTMTLLADAEVSYDVTQDTTAPFTVEAYATFYSTYTPADTGIAVQSQQSLGGYLAGASGISGTNSNYNGVLCTTWEATLGSSTPSSFNVPDTKTLATDNDPYLTDVSGVTVFRRTVTTYAFP
jgi:hypothetical protein